MARSTGPILAVGSITLLNDSVVNGRPIDWRVPVMTGIAAALFALAEKGWEEGAVTLSWMALLTILLARLRPGQPSPIESFVAWLGKK